MAPEAPSPGQPPLDSTRGVDRRCLHLDSVDRGSRIATLDVVDTIPQKELRNDVSAVLRRVESGETVVITVSGRPVAELSPTGHRRWVKGSKLAGIWSGPSPHGLDDDLARFDVGLTDPFDR